MVARQLDGPARFSGVCGPVKGLLWGKIVFLACLAADYVL